jgi:hypothetical protein
VLEKNLGVRLFTRTARGAQFTIDGQAFLPRLPAAQPQAATGRAAPPAGAAPGSSVRGGAGEVPSVLRSERFVDKSPTQIWATLLDEGTHLCSVSTVYRLLRDTARAGGHSPRQAVTAVQARTDHHRTGAGGGGSRDR